MCALLSTNRSVPGAREVNSYRSCALGDAQHHYYIEVIPLGAAHWGMRSDTIIEAETEAETDAEDHTLILTARHKVNN